VKTIKITKRTETTRSETVEESSVDTYGDTPLGGLTTTAGKSMGLANWTRLSAFTIAEVQSPHPPTRPGKAELRARVELQAVDETGTAVPIPVEDVKSLLTLVDYGDGSVLADWRIEYGDLVGVAPGRQSIDFWITTSKPCGPEVRAAASILPPGQSVPIQTRPASGHGFDSQVDLGAVVTNPFWEITTFKLERVSTSDRVFVNGLQQIKLKVELAFTDNMTGKPGVPTPEELASLTIAFADEGTPLPIDDDVSGATWWVTSPGVASANDTTYDKGYLPHPFIAKVVTPAVRQAVASPRASLFHYFYIACRGTPAQTVQLCAFVKCRDGWIYRTNGTNTDPCGDSYSGNADMQVDVRGENPGSGTVEQYTWVRDVLYGDDGGIENKVVNPESVHRYSLSFVDHGQEEVGLRAVVVEPKGMIQWKDKVAQEREACFTGYAVPGSTDVTWNSVIPTGSKPLPVLPSADSRKAAIVLVGRNDIPYQSGMPNGPLTLKTTDWYGNTNTLQVKFDGVIGDARWKLVLSR
jgi:hypothetical protein